MRIRLIKIQNIKFEYFKLILKKFKIWVLIVIGLVFEIKFFYIII